MAVAFALLVSVLTVNMASAQSSSDGQDLKSGESEWCGTQILYDLKYGSKREGQLCPPEGPCDDPVTRDGWIPDSLTPITYVNVFFHVFRNDDGTNPAASTQDVADAVDDLNAQYLPWRIQFEYDMQFVNSTAFRNLTSNGEFDAMKNAYAVRPDSQCNIYVASVNVNGSVFSFGTFPWDPDALNATGGIVLNRTQFPPFSHTVMSHEMGHNLGLWHTHHGVSEVGSCGACYESPGSGNGDVAGDFCSDTPPTPTNFNCGGPGGSDGCTGAAWGSTDFRNIMGYGPSACVDHFTSQQGGRINCWTDDMLSSWLNNVRIQADTVFGPETLDVTFDGVTGKTVLNWYWEFGDGDTAAIQSPFHSYSAGLYDVLVSIQATDGDYSTMNKDFIWVHADTMSTPGALEVDLGVSTRIDVYARNYLPLQSLMVPFTWNGPYNVQYDSVSTVGLRTESISNQQLVSFDPGGRRAAYSMTPSAGDYLLPGSGPVLSLWLTVISGDVSDTNAVVVTSYASYSPKFTVTPGEYNPVIVAGSIVLGNCIAGDVNGDTVGPDVVDLTYLVDFLFAGGPSPPNPASGNVDGMGDTDIVDLTYLVDFLFGIGSAPVCP